MRRWIGYAIMAIALCFGPITLSAASTDPGLPVCASVGHNVEVCVPSWIGVPDFAAIRLITSKVLVEEYPPIRVYLLAKDVMAKDFGGYYLDRGVILVVADKQSGQSYIHELWHHRLATEGVLVADHHCTMGRSEEYAETIRLKGDALRAHKMQLITKCNDVFSYPED